MVHGRPSMMLGAGGIAGLRIIDTISLRDDHLAANSEIASRQQSAPSASAVASERIADLAAARYAIYRIKPRNMPAPVFRFAPSPNGYLHLGHALSALINFDMARAAGGSFLLRMEDIDTARCRPQYEDAICEDLTWLGVRWEEPVR